MTFSEKQWEKSFNLNDKLVEMDRDSLPEQLAAKNYFGYLSNLNGIVTLRIKKGLLLWRVGKNPTEYFSEAIDYYEQIVDFVAENTVKPNSYIDFISYDIAVIGYLLNRNVTPNIFNTPKRTLRIRKYFDEMLRGTAPVAQTDIDHHLKKLSIKKDHKLFVETYKTYFSIMASEPGEEQERLIRHAEQLYEKRSTDKYFHISDIDGGGPSNPYVVDFRLGAVMKKIGWQGESRHKWLWD